MTKFRPSRQGKRERCHYEQLNASRLLAHAAIAQNNQLLVPQTRFHTRLLGGRIYQSAQRQQYC